MGGSGWGRGVSIFHSPVQFFKQFNSGRKTSDGQRSLARWLKAFLQTRLVFLNNLHQAQDTGLFVNNQCFQRPQIANYWNNGRGGGGGSVLHGLSRSKSV